MSKTGVRLLQNRRLAFLRRIHEASFDQGPRRLHDEQTRGRADESSSDEAQEVIS